MRCTKFEVTALFGVGIFLVGAACVVAVAMHSVFPAREEQNLKEINCMIASGNLNTRAKCPHDKRDDTSYPCLRVYVLCGNEGTSNASSVEEQPRLLLKDFHSVHSQCTYEPEECMDKTKTKPHLLQSFQRGNLVGSPLQCYYNPKDPDQIVRQKASRESYNKLVLNNVVWPLAIVMLGVVVLATAACMFSPRSQYERLRGISRTSLQQTTL